MPDPNDPRARALANITQSSRAFGRDRRRGEDASTDPAFQAALTERDPARRREMLAQYARGRAQDLFPPAPTAIRAPQPVDPRFADSEMKMRLEGNQMADRLRQSGDLAAWQGMPFEGAAEDDGRSHLGRMDAGRELLERRDDANMFADVQRYAPGDVDRYQNTPMVGAEDSPESHRARINAGKGILAGAARDRLDEESEARDTARIEARQFPEDAAPTGDGIDQIANAAQDLQRRVTARRRR